jgi:uncharacterized membrane protein
MAEFWWWVMDVILPVILLVVLVWLVFMRRSNRSDKTTFDGTKAGYADEEKRRREGTDDL